MDIQAELFLRFVRLEKQWKEPERECGRPKKRAGGSATKGLYRPYSSGSIWLFGAIFKDLIDHARLVGLEQV